MAGEDYRKLQQPQRTGESGNNRRVHRRKNRHRDAAAHARMPPPPLKIEEM